MLAAGRLVFWIVPRTSHFAGPAGVTAWGYLCQCLEQGNVAQVEGERAKARGRAAREGNAIRSEQKASEDAEDDEEMLRTLGLTLSLWFVVLGFGRIVHGRVLVLAGITRR